MTFFLLQLLNFLLSFIPLTIGHRWTPLDSNGFCFFKLSFTTFFGSPNVIHVWPFLLGPSIGLFGRHDWHTSDTQYIMPQTLFLFLQSLFEAREWKRTLYQKKHSSRLFKFKQAFVDSTIYKAMPVVDSSLHYACQIHRRGFFENTKWARVAHLLGLYCRQRCKKV